jgi:hypothetical protein
MPVVDERPVDSTAGSNGPAWRLFRIDWSRAAWIGVALYAAWALRDFLQDGLPLDFDAHSHLSRAGFVERAFAAGQYPAWANDWYGGYRLLEFYSPLWYWLSAATSLVLGDLVLSVKLVVWAAQVASVLVLFAFVKRITARTLPAVLGAVLLIHSAERGMVFGVVGNYPSTLLYLTIPALLLLAWECSEGRVAPMRLFAGQSLLLGAMLAAHFANASLVLPAILAFEIARIAQAMSGRRDKAQAFIAVGASLVVALALVAFMLVPAIIHLDRASLVLEGATITADRISLERLLVAAGFVPGGFTHLFVRDHGAFWMALGILAGIASLSGAYRTWLPLFAGLCVSLSTITLVDERAAIGLAFFLYPLCALAFDAVSRRAQAFGLRGAMLVIPLAGIVVAVAFPVEVLLPRYMPASSFDVYRSIPESATRSRTFDVSPTTISLDGFYGPSSFSPYLSGRAIPFGAYPQGASPATQVRSALTSMLVGELSGPRPVISDDALDVLYLDHVQFLVDRGSSPATSRLQLGNGVGEPLTSELLKLLHASPALFAPQLAPLPDWVRDAGARENSPRLLGVLEQTWQEDRLDGARSQSLDSLFRTRERQDWKVFVPLLRALELNRTETRATRIFVDELLPSKGPSSSGPVSFAVLSHLEEPSRARIVAHASQSGYVRLSYARDPDQIVSLDGEIAETTSDSLGGAITLAFPAGTHSIDVRAPAPILQTRYLWLSLSLILLLAAALVRERRATRLPGRPRVSEV